MGKGKLFETSFPFLGSSGLNTCALKRFLRFNVRSSD